VFLSRAKVVNDRITWRSGVLEGGSRPVGGTVPGAKQEEIHSYRRQHQVLREIIRVGEW